MEITQGIPRLMQELAEKTEPFPRVPMDLLEALELKYPNQCPDLNIRDRDFGVIVGQLEVVRFLRDMYERPPEMKED